MLIGDRKKFSSSSFASILDATKEQQVKEAAEVSMGTEVSADDLDNMKILADQVVEMTDYRYIEVFRITYILQFIDCNY